MSARQYTQSQFQRAHAMSALDYAFSRGYDLVPVGQRFELREHRSMVFKRDGWWIWNSRGLVGRALEFVRYYEGRSWPEAVLLLCGADIQAAAAPPPSSPVTFSLPPPAQDQGPLMEYLHGRRHLHPELLLELIRQQRIYLSATAYGTVIYRNAVFVGYDASGVPRSAQLRGTAYSSTFKGMAAASDKHTPFEIPAVAGADRLAVFEGAIDALSHATLDILAGRPWRQTARISTGGNPAPGMIKRYLAAHPDIRDVLLCFDADAAGRRLAQTVSRELASCVGRQLRESYPPSGKDWNDYLGLKEARPLL